MSKPLKLGIVGCGGISHAHANAARNIPQKVRFLACCDVRKEAAENWAAQYGAESIYTNYEEMLRDEKLDGVLLATWPNQHREQIERCLDLGLNNILCEKSLALTGQEAIEIWEMATASGAFIMEGFMYRHHPAIRKLESLLSSGEIGIVDSVRAAFSSYDAEEASASDSSSRNWRQRKECGGGVPYDFTCYAVNACGYFIRSIPVRAFALGHISEKYDTINRLYGLIEYNNGRIGIIESSKKAEFNQELQISGSHGILKLPISWTIPGKITIEKVHSEGWANLATDTYTIQKANSYQLQLENFANVILGEAQPVVPLIESVVNIFALDALAISLFEKRMVEITMPYKIIQALMKSWKGQQ